MKLAKSYDEQLEILENRGLYIDDKEKASEILSNVNYYNLTGYLFQFKDSQGNYNHGVSLSKELHYIILIESCMLFFPQLSQRLSNL
ncbi:hypothetical protein ACI1T5_08925 [Lactococcus petauri]|uniref:hypothetical protein n=1 Tax=Lactococcus petauri TaxID=1940789 RepID=UPI00385425BD